MRNAGRPPAIQRLAEHWNGENKTASWLSATPTLRFCLRKTWTHTSRSWINLAGENLLMVRCAWHWYVPAIFWQYHAIVAQNHQLIGQRLLQLHIFGQFLNSKKVTGEMTTVDWYCLKLTWRNRPVPDKLQATNGVSSLMTVSNALGSNCWTPFLWSILHNNTDGSWKLKIEDAWNSTWASLYCWQTCVNLLDNSVMT